MKGRDHMRDLDVSRMVIDLLKLILMKKGLRV
jgi:hypothetical protein